MAKVIKKDSDAYFKEKESFLRELQNFHETRGTPCRYAPKIGGKEIDLYLLYCLVTSNGGWVKVNSRNQWNSLLKEFHLPKNCVNVSVALKQIYLRYLDKYEKAHFLGETHNAIEDDEDTGGGRHKRWSSAKSTQPAVPLTYNHSQHQITESVRASSNLSKSLYTASEYDKLGLSLLCPLPNEQDFALNVCTLLSNEFRAAQGVPTGIRLGKHQRLLRYLLAHAGVFADDTLRDYFTANYRTVRTQSLESFWDDVVEDRRILSLMREMIEDDARIDNVANMHIHRIRQRENEKRKREAETGDGEEEVMEVGSDEEKGGGDGKDCRQRRLKVRLRLRPEDKSLFAIGRALGTREGVGQRVLQIATVLRNFTFNEENNALLSRDLTFLRFMILCCYSNWSCLRQLGLDMFSNISAELTMDETLAPVLFDIISTGLGSEDRAAVLSSIEILNKLGTVEKNEEILLRSLQQKVYNQVCTLLTLHDIMLLIHTLECVYSLTSLGERACNAIMRVHGAMDVLVSLVTVEAQSFGPKACILMRVVETVGPPSSDPADNADPSPSLTPLTTAPPSTGPLTGLQAPTFTLPMALAPVAVAVPVPLSQVQQPPSSTTSSVTAGSMTPMMRHRPPGPGPGGPRPQHVITSTGSSSGPAPRHSYRVITPNKVIVSSSQSPHTSSSAAGTSGSRPVEENGEMFATQWLRANFEHASLPGRAIEQAELYKQYINAASRAGRKGVIAPLHFPRVVRSVFGAQIGPKQVIPAPTPGSSAPPPPPIHVYEGIQVRGKQPIITQTIAIAPSPSLGPGTLQNPMSPILKAQLSAPPKPQMGVASTSATGGSQGSQSPLPGPSNTARTKAHPHLSQALLGSGGNAGSSLTPTAGPSTSGTASSAGGTASPAGNDPSSSTSLIKSLLANKVGPEPPSGGQPVSVCANPNPTSQQHQPGLIVNTVVASPVTQRQQQAQKMLSQSPAAPSPSTSSTGPQPSTGAVSSRGPPPSTQSGTSTTLSSGIIKSTSGGTQMRLNGVTINMQQVTNHIVENSLDPKPPATPPVSTPTSNTDPSSPAQPCPPLAPLSQCKTPTNSSNSSSIQSGDGLQAGSSASLVDGTSVVVNGGISNSINSAGDTSDQTYKENIAKQSLMLVDLLEKSISDKDPPTINGAIRIGEKGLDLFTSIDSKTKLSQQQQQQAQSVTVPASGTPNVNSTTSSSTPTSSTPTSTPNVNSSSGVIRRVSTELEAHNNINAGKANGTTSLLPVKQNGAEQQVAGLKRPRPHDGGDANDQPAVKKVHVNGDMNLPVEEQDENNVKASSTAANLYAALAADVLEDEDIVEVTPAAAQQTAPPAPQPGPGPGQNIIMSGGPASGPGGGGRQQILVTGGTGGLPQRLQMMGQHYVVTQQPQLVQGHSGQTVLVAQTGGQQGGPGSKTIIILQPSSSSASSSTNTLASSKTIVTSMPPSTTITTNTNQKVIVSVPPLGGNAAPGTPSQHTSVVHRTPIRPQPGGMSSNSPATTVIKQVPDTRPPRPPSGFQQQFLQSQKLLQQPQQQQQQQPPPPSPSPSPQQPLPGQFICEWRGCMRNFKSANEVYMHACECHCPVTPTQEIQCLWERCDAMRRKRFSHMTHLYDRHCNPDVLKMMAVRRKQLSLSGKTEIPPPPAPAPHPGYAPNAAFNAIKRHALEFVNPKELQDENEGPVTKSIRLTSSLILRNLVIYSNTCRRHLVSYEPHLASVALSNVESSKTIAQVLFDMNDTQNR